MSQERFPHLTYRQANEIIIDQESKLIQLEDERDYYRDLLCKAQRILKARYMLDPDGERKWDGFINNEMDGYDGTLQP